MPEEEPPTLALPRLRGREREGTVWRVLARVCGADAATAVLALLDDLASAVSAFEMTPEEWRVEAYSPSPVLTSDLDECASGSSGR